MNRIQKSVRFLGILLLLLAAVPASGLQEGQTSKPAQEESSLLPAWFERLSKFGEMAKGVRDLPPDLNRSAGREFLRNAFPETEGIGRTFGTAQKIAKVAKVLQWLDTASDIKDVGYAAKEGGAGAAALRGLEVAGRNAVASFAAEYGAAAGAAAGTALLGPPHGTIIGGAIGGAVSAYAASYAYEKTVKTVFDDRIQKIIEAEKKISEEEKAKQNPQVPKPPSWREDHPGKGDPPVLGPPTPPDKRPSSPATLKCTRLIVVPSGDIEAGGSAEFSAFADLELDTAETDLPPTVQKNAGVTGNAVWTFSAGQKAGPGKVTTDCSLAGQSIIATATFMGQTAAATVKVKNVPLVSLNISATPESALPGKTVSLSAEATYKNAFCEFTRTNPPGLQFSASEGAILSGDSLTIDLDKEDGYIMVSATLSSENISSNTAVITIVPPILERVVLSAPATVDVCQTVTFELIGYYSHKPDEAVRLSTDSVLWTIAGRCAPLGPNLVQATWPGETIVATASTPYGQTVDAQVMVNPLPNSSAYFPLQDVSIATQVKVGESITNTAIEFACQGSRHSAIPAKNVEWQSDAPDVLSCSQNGVCIGLSPGKANVRLLYFGKEITSRIVTVYEGEDEFEAEEEISGQDAEEAARAPEKKGEEVSGNSLDEAKGEKYRQAGEKAGKALAKILLKTLAGKFDKDAAPPPSEPPSSSPKGESKPGAGTKQSTDDPFAGNWRIASWRLVQHSEKEAMEEADAINQEAGQYYLSFAIRQSGNTYSISGLRILIKSIGSSGSTLTIVGQDRSQNSVSDETIQLTPRGGRLVGTWRSVFAPDFYGRRQWQVAEVIAVRN